MKKNEYIQHLKDLRACSNAIEWSVRTEGTPQELWEKCERGNWLLWRIGKIIDRDNESQLRRLTLAKAKCAGLVLHLMKDERSIKAIEVAERFGNGTAPREELVVAHAAAYAAYAAAAAAATHTAATHTAAAYAATHTHTAAAYAAAAAAYAAYAAYAATHTAAAYAAYAARKEILGRCANCVREVFPYVEINFLKGQDNEHH
jgi:hypothetical protein